MAIQVYRKYEPAGFITFEFVGMAANEVIIVPVTRTTSKNGDSTLALMSTAGVKISYTIDHPSAVEDALRQGGVQYPFLSSVDSTDFKGRVIPAYNRANTVDAFARVWQADQTMTATSILELKTHMTCLRITAPAVAGAFVLGYGDY